MKTWIMATLAGLTLTVSAISAQELAARESSTAPEISVEFSSDFYGKYVWRGQNLNDDPVYQPGLSATLENLTAGIWGNVDLSDYNDRSGDFSELDYYLDYTDTLPGVEGISYSVGVVYYDFPGSAADGSRAPDTTELYAGLSFDLPLSPSITVYHDVDEADGTYINLGISHSIEQIVTLGSIPIGLDLSAGIGWASGSYNDYYWGTNQSKMQDVSLSLALPFELFGWSISPSVNYVTLLSDDLRSTDAYDTASDYFFAGLSVSRAF